ncbi:hypothetical protein HPB49_008745 [Dermacentor silvarum]|uniref:Uncharacterized protein n=1 Tax=Dermacentor silvarum TaxID=543639 RepID=A0ACB8DC57_DERSI|nr:hypothetical protein HPB49_008745 [Dermacentor silvarum]
MDLAKVSGPNATTGQQPADQPLEPQPEIATASGRPESSEPPSKEPDATAGQDNMDQSESAASGLAGKRPWDEAKTKSTDSNVTEDATNKTSANTEAAEVHQKPPEEDFMDCREAEENSAVVKRPRDDGGEESKDASSSEPPAKAATSRRPRPTAKPNVKEGEKRAAQPPT